MKHLIIAALFPAAFTLKSDIQAGNLQKPISVIQMNDTATIEGLWILQPVMASDTAAGQLPYIKFILKDNSFTGNTGCNNMSGNFVIKQDALRFGEHMMSTKMICPGYNERPFLDNLLKTNRYEIKDGVLQLMYNTTVLSKWVRHLDSTVTKQI